MMLLLPAGFFPVLCVCIGAFTAMAGRAGDASVLLSLNNPVVCTLPWEMQTMAYASQIGHQQQNKGPATLPSLQEPVRSLGLIEHG